MNNTLTNSEQQEIRWSNLPLYNQKVGEHIFTIIDNKANIYQSGSIQVIISPQKEGGDFIPAIEGRRITNAQDFKITIHIKNDENIYQEIEGIEATFCIANVQYSGMNEERCIFTECFWLPEEYRGWQVAADMFQTLIEFAKNQRIKEIHTAAVVTKWGEHIFEILKQRNIHFYKNPNAQTNSQWSIISKDGNAIFIIPIY